MSVSSASVVGRLKSGLALKPTYLRDGAMHPKGSTLINRPPNYKQYVVLNRRGLPLRRHNLGSIRRRC